MKAIFQGEMHTSAADRESLEARLDGDVDALFVEGRDDAVAPERWSLRYVVFLAGVFTILWIEDALTDEPDLTEASPVPVHDEIDTELPTLYARLPSVWIAAAAMCASVALSLGVFVPSFSVPFFDLPVAATAVYTAAVKLVVVAGTPLLFAGTLLGLELRWLGSRDQDMAASVDQIATENGYETVVVSCGDRHVDRLSALLEDRGWETEVNRTNHTLRSRI